MLEKNEGTETGEAIAHALMEKLGVQPHQLIEGAYIDLLAKAAKQASPSEEEECQSV